MTSIYGAAHLPPGQLASIESLEPNLTSVLWGPWARQVFGHNCLIAAAQVDAGNTGYTSHLRAGLLLGKTSLTDYVVWDPTATDGSQNIAGVLMHAVAMQYAGSTSSRWTGYVLQAGCVKAKGLIIPGQATPGLSGQTLEYAVRRQMADLFLIDDAIQPYRGAGSRGTFAKTTSYTVVEADYGKAFTTLGAAGAVVFTLPATPKLGLEFSFYNMVDQNMTITATTAIQLTYNNIAATNTAFSTASNKIGAKVTVRGNGTKWEVTPSVFSGQVATVS